MATQHSFWRTAASFGRDRDGNFAVLTGMAATTLALAVGFAINIVQAYQVKTALRDALDAAVTSTARDLTTGKIEEGDARRMVEAFLQANSDTKFTNEQVFVLDSLVVDKSARTLEATASAHVDIAFPLFSTQDPKVAIASAAVYSDKKIEVSMMLDVTGSMEPRWPKDKIGDLRDAASSAVRTMLEGQDPSNPRIRVALVPYAEAVNVGALANSTVFAEKNNGSDLPPAIDDPIAVSASAWRPDACATERKLANGQPDYSDDSPFSLRKKQNGKEYRALVNRDNRVRDCPSASLVPLTANMQKLLNAIDAFRASGVTSGAIAAQWGYYMLSPAWRSAIRNASLGDGPADYDSRKIAKVAILMTDGQFNTAFAGIADDGKQVQTKHGAESRRNAEAICRNMKADGIEVYTIGFDLDNKTMSATERDQAKTVLRNCASPDTQAIKHYFEASTGAELDAAFKEIIRNNERLALTK